MIPSVIQCRRIWKARPDVMLRKCHIPIPFVILLLLCGMLHSQNYHTRIYNLSDGLPTTRINGITQDHMGRMWFSSRAGMLRYDGRAWTRVDTLVNTSLANFDGPCCTDSKGQIWVSNRLQIARFKDNGYDYLPKFPTENKSLVRELAVTLSAGEDRVVVVFEDNTVLLWHAGQWVNLNWESDGSETKPRVVDVTTSSKGIWFATQDGLYFLKNSAVIAERITTTGEEFLANGICFDQHRGELWLVGTQSIGKIQIETNRLEVLTTGLARGEPAHPHHSAHVTTDGQGGIWFGSPFYVYHFSKDNTLNLLRRGNGLGSEGMTAVFRDREQNVWIASARGITKIGSNPFLGYDRNSGLLDDEVSAIGQTKDGVIVLGHQGGLTFLEEQGPRIQVVGNGAFKNRVVDLHLDQNGVLWASCQYAGVGRIDESGEFQVVHSMPGIMANGHRIDDSGVEWVATQQNLFKGINGKLEKVLVANTPGKSSEAIRRLTKGKSGALYASTSNFGVARIRNGTIESLATAENCKDVFTAIETEDGALWSGTINGLAKFEDDHFELSTAPQIKRPVYSLLEDSHKNLWIGTDDGVFCWDGKNLEHFNSKKGLLGAETNRGALLEDDEGRIWIGTARGLSRYDRDLDIDHPVKPLVFITKLHASGKTAKLESGITLPADSKDITFHFEASSFVDEHHVRFRTFLENYDDKWSEPRELPLREVRYTNLPSGEFRLHLQAIDVEGRKSDIAISPTVSIEKQIFEQPWFLALCAFGFVALTWSGFAFVNQRRYSHELERQVEIRATELQKAERANAQLARLESLGVLAGGIAHDFNNALTVISGFVTMITVRSNPDSQTKDYVRKIEGACERAQSLTRQLLTFSKGGAPNRELSSLEHIVREAASFSLLGSNVECHFDFPDDLPAIHVDTGQFHQVFNNLTINARQAMLNGGKIKFHARQIMGDVTVSKIVIRVEDEGKGIDPQIVSRVFDPYFTTKTEGSGLGLSIVHSIIGNHDGTISIEPSEKSGTTFVITIPASDEILPHDVVVDDVEKIEMSRVLVLDDEPGIRILVSDALGSHDCQVSTVRDGQEAITAYREAMEQGKPFCAVITDLTIPGGMGGAEASREILAFDPNAYLIVTSGYANEPILANYLDYGFSDKLPKPFSIEELISTASRVPKRKPASGQIS
ncbi:MAG: signal transduction histidine kinase/ligand-binding sensor domain-containing protein [Planctomycetota bacterium]|jgi:signal transduction histidine kinase/ligand-binding sensor domain-containing protein/CheY-like chemotaxis protein